MMLRGRHIVLSASIRSNSSIEFVAAANEVVETLFCGFCTSAAPAPAQQPCRNRLHTEACTWRTTGLTHAPSTPAPVFGHVWQRCQVPRPANSPIHRLASSTCSPRMQHLPTYPPGAASSFSNQPVQQPQSSQDTDSTMLVTERRLSSTHTEPKHSTQAAANADLSVNAQVDTRASSHNGWFQWRTSFLSSNAADEAACQGAKQPSTHEVPQNSNPAASNAAKDEQAEGLNASDLGILGALAFFGKRILLFLGGKKLLAGLTVVAVKKALFLPAWLLVLGSTFGLSIFFWTAQTETPITRRKQTILAASILDDEVSKIGLDERLQGQGLVLCKDSEALTKRARAALDLLLRGLERVEDLPDREKWLAYDWKIHIAHPPGGHRFVNAMALGPSTIVVSSDMMALMSTDEQLSFIVGHELGHLLARHYLEDFNLSMYWNFVVYMLERFLGIQTPEETIALLFRLPYSRNFEYEADQIGMTLMAKACLNIEAGVEAMHKLSDDAARFGDKGPFSMSSPAFPQHWRTHPDYPARIARMRAHVPALLRESGCGYNEELRAALAELKQNKQGKLSIAQLA